MKIKTYKRGIEERQAFCQDCDWNNETLRANIFAGYHVKETGHKVDVYTETRTIVKPIKESL